MTTTDDRAGRAGGGPHRLRDPRRAQPLPPAERHHPVAAAGDLSGAAGELRPHLHPDRLPALRLPGHRLAAAAGRRASTPTAADVPPLHRRHGREPDRPVILAFATHYWALLARRHGDRHRLVDLPPRQLARRPHRLGRPLRLRPVVLPGRRQHRQRHRPAARRLRRAAVRPARASPGSRRWRCSG